MCGLITTKCPSFDFNPVKEKTVNNTLILIEKVRNLLNNIINELRRFIINKDYIKECNIEIEKVISEIIDLNNKKKGIK